MNDYYYYNNNLLMSFDVISLIKGKYRGIGFFYMLGCLEGLWELDDGVDGVWWKDGVFFIEFWFFLLFFDFFLEMFLDCWDVLLLVLEEKGCIFLRRRCILVIFGCWLGMVLIYCMVICSIFIIFFLMFW